jgi:hypothetical protein
MLKKTILTLSLSCLLHTSFAETCPTPNELKNQQLNNWQPLDIDNGTPISAQRLEQFTHDVSQLALVEWMADAPEGSAHCYYHDTTHPDYMNVFLAKPQLKPDAHADEWKKMNDDVMQCDPQTSQCQFTESLH